MLIANLLGISVLIYVFWRKLKDDYHYEKIFNLAFGVLFSFILSLVVLKFIPESFTFWTVFASVLLGFYIGIRKQKMNFFESLDAFIIGSLPWLSFVYLYSTSKTESLSSFIAFWFTLICIFAYLFINSSYKGFTWYKSGRVGIAGIMTIILFFISRIVSAVFMPNTLYMVGGYEVYLSLSGALLFIVLLYNLIRIKE